MKKFTFRQKNRMLVMGAFLLLLAVYGFSIRRTISLHQSNQKLTRQIQRAQQAPAQIAQLQQRLDRWGEMGGASSGATTEYTKVTTLRQELFEQIGAYTQQYGVQLESFQEAEVFREGNTPVETHTLSLEGSFQDQLRVSEALEKNLQHGRVASLVFTTRQERRSKQTYLIGTLSVQGIHQQNHEP